MGTRKVHESMSDEKSNFVERVFTEVPGTYELVNHVLTFGFDILWRRRAARIAAKANGGQWADMCTGTGEMAVYLSRLAPKGTTIYGIDFSEPMLEAAKRKPEAKHIKFVVSDIKALPFPDGNFDLIAMSFATRNINLSKEILTQSFAEYYRVLKPGGRFVNLETSIPSSWPVRRCFELYVKLFVKSIGSLISGSKTAYAYLGKTIPRFYSAEELAEIMRDGGFKEVTFEKHFFGAVAIHQGMKQ
jgi:demethylmenaquinone methyltransferase/2-methoxy-6-polyprenyl-1,4-benzoquinol methylase